jgi:hypothetical protein
MNATQEVVNACPVKHNESSASLGPSAALPLDHSPHPADFIAIDLRISICEMKLHPTTLFVVAVMAPCESG